MYLTSEDPSSSNSEEESGDNSKSRKEHDSRRASNATSNAPKGFSPTKGIRLGISVGASTI